MFPTCRSGVTEPGAADDIASGRTLAVAAHKLAERNAQADACPIRRRRRSQLDAVRSDHVHRRGRIRATGRSWLLMLVLSAARPIREPDFHLSAIFKEPEMPSGQLATIGVCYGPHQSETTNVCRPRTAGCAGRVADEASAHALLAVDRGLPAMT